MGLQVATFVTAALALLVTVFQATVRYGHLEQSVKDHHVSNKEDFQAIDRRLERIEDKASAHDRWHLGRLRRGLDEDE